MSSTQPRIAIVGGGPSGLALALLLHKAEIPAVVYELRQRPTEEELSMPSGSLDLHEESGLKAIRACGLYETFLTKTADCSESTKIINGAGEALHTDDDDHSRPEISRHELMKLLLSHIPNEMIQWSSKIRSVERVADGKTKVDFGTGSDIFDVVVGADGSWSRVRPLLSDATPQYTGLQNLTLTIASLPERYPELAKFCGDGTMFLLDDGNGVTGQRGVRNSERLYITMASEHEDFAEREKLHDMDADALCQRLTTSNGPYAAWGELPKKLIKVACDDSAEPVNRGASTRYDLRPLYMLPIGHRWTHVPGVTIIGDAAHLMTPYAGEGVNLALVDALDIATAITQAWATASSDAAQFQAAFSPLLKAAEEQIQARGEEKAEETDRNKQLLFGENGAQEFASLMQRMMEEHGEHGPEH